MGEQKKSSKAGKNVKGCEAYKTQNRLEKNKASRLFKHLVRCSGKNHEKPNVKNDFTMGYIIHDTSAIKAIKPLIGYLPANRRVKLQFIGAL